MYNVNSLPFVSRCLFGVCVYRVLCIVYSICACLSVVLIASVCFVGVSGKRT